MLSEKQLKANQANAKKSTGPKSAAGKKRSSLNAVRHGLTGQVVVLPTEDMEAFKQFTTAIVDSFKTADAAEKQLAQSYADLQWRINRATSVESTMFTLGIMEKTAENLAIEHAEPHNAISNAKTFRNQSQEFDRIGIYTQRLINSADKVLKQLKQLQAERKERQEKEMADASLLYHYHRARSESFDPRQNGFDLTIAQVKAYIHLQTLRTQASKPITFTGKHTMAA
jgi:hypothetical protein